MTEPELTRPCVVCRGREARHASYTCSACPGRIAENLVELVERWALVPYALESGRAGEDSRISGSRERSLPGGDALNYTANSNLYTSGRLTPAYRTTGALPGRPKLDPCAVDEKCPECAQRCQRAHGHVEKHRCAGGHRWAYRQQSFARTPILDEHGDPTCSPDGDQYGPVNPIEILWSWARDWRTYRHVGEVGPEPDLVSVVTWLRNRVDWAADHHPAIDDFADEVYEALTGLREVLNVRRYTQRYREPCPRCDTKALYREVDPERGASAWVQCGQCGNLWRESEFARLSVILDAEARKKVAT